MKSLFAALAVLFTAANSKTPLAFGRPFNLQQFESNSTVITTATTGVANTNKAN